MGFNVTLSGAHKRIVFHPSPFAAGDVMVNTLLKMGGHKVSLFAFSDKCTDHLRVEVVCNHRAALVSQWLATDPHEPFSTYLESVVQEYGRYGRLYGYSMPNYYLKYETLQFEFDVLCVNAGLPQTELVGFKPTKIDRSDCISGLVEQRIQSVFGDEMEFLGYGSTKK